MHGVLCVSFLLAYFSSSASLARENGDMAEKTRLLVVTIATDPNDGYLQYMQSAKHFGLDVKVSRYTFDHRKRMKGTRVCINIWTVR
jgi:hypothetical protein